MCGPDILVRENSASLGSISKSQGQFVTSRRKMSSSAVNRFCLGALLALFLPFAGFAQSPAGSRKVPQNQPAQPTPSPKAPAIGQSENPGEPQDIETLKTDTNLVTVPVVATDADGSYVADLRREEFTVAEDGVQQEIAFFGTVSKPFHVVLMLDTSASTQEKLRLIQQAAGVFVDQLQPADRVKVISFDDQLRDLSEFTSDRSTLKAAINRTTPGKGTRVYDAVELALNTIRRIQGRKAIVIFTDGVDWHSGSATFDGTIRWLDEEGVIVYPIRYDTRSETERLAREQADATEPVLPTLGVIRRQPSGTTAPTFPSDDPDSIPTSGSSQPKTGPFGLPLPAEILRRRRESERNRDPNRGPTAEGIPSPPEIRGSGQPPSYPPGMRPPSGNDSISTMLDMAYSTADTYLETLARKTGGKLLRADTLGSLPAAFSNIAAELRTQYVLGYYPLNKEKDDHYRRIKVTAARKNVVIRARPGYLATSAR
jgi:von Willebrand factor type A domain